jgi:DNA-binding transcriptional LysR family regulator
MRVLPELRLADLATLLAVHRTASITGAARELRVTPSQVSKAISRLERYFGVRLLVRGARGVAPTPAARRMLPRMESAVQELRRIGDGRDNREPDVELTIAGPSYIIGHVLPAIAAHLPHARLRGLELAPAYLRAYIAENAFDIALSPGGISACPTSWTSDAAGELRSALLGRPSFVKKLGAPPLPVERVRTLPFIAPVTPGTDRFVAIDDDCPLPLEERRVAHEAQTVGAALEFASRTEHVVFGPVLAARRFLELGAIVEIPVAGWDVRDTVHVLCNGDRVLSRVRTAVVRGTREVLSAKVTTN